MEHTAMRPRSRLSGAWMFIRHFLEMCVAMCVGGGLLNALIFVVGPPLLGYPDLRETTPALALLLIALVYTVPMAAWMRIRGMPWRPILEMSGAVVALAVVLIGLAGLGVITDSGLRSQALGFCGAACVAMLPVMLVRLDLYTGRSAAQAEPVGESVSVA